MAFTKFQAAGTFSLLATANKLEALPAFVYKDGKKTDEQRRWKNKPIFRLRGALPLINGEVVPEAYIYLTSENLPDVSVGQELKIDGEISVRAAKGFGLTCSLFGELTSNDAKKGEFSLEEK